MREQLAAGNWQLAEPKTRAAEDQDRQGEMERI
jgi:hypothetical protein